MILNASKLLLTLAATSLLLGFYTAFNATNDCDLGDIVLVLGLPGFLLTGISSALAASKIKFSLRSPLWFCIFVLLLGFTALGFERAHLIKTAVGDCQ